MQHLSDFWKMCRFCLVGVKCIKLNWENRYFQDFIFRCWINGDLLGWVKEKASVMSVLQVCLSSELSQLSATETVSAAG